MLQGEEKVFKNLNSMYQRILSDEKELSDLKHSHVLILFGSTGSGKSTLANSLVQGIDNIQHVENSLNIIPRRMNRSLLDYTNTMILKFLISLITFKKIDDFNGQPKLFKREEIGNIEDYPNDFTFDFFLFRKLYGNFKALPIIQKDRVHGISSWSGDIFKRLKIFFGYISAAFKK